MDHAHVLPKPSSLQTKTTFSTATTVLISARHVKVVLSVMSAQIMQSSSTESVPAFMDIFTINNVENVRNVLKDVLSAMKKVANLVNLLWFYQLENVSLNVALVSTNTMEFVSPVSSSVLNV